MKLLKHKRSISILKKLGTGILSKGSPIFFWVGSKKRKQLLTWVEVANVRTIFVLGPQPFSLLQVKRRERKARESALPTILNRARKRITHPPPLSHLLCIFLFVGRGSLCAQKPRAGTKWPVSLFQVWFAFIPNFLRYVSYLKEW